MILIIEGSYVELVDDQFVPTGSVEGGTEAEVATGDHGASVAIVPRGLGELGEDDEAGEGVHALDGGAVRETDDVTIVLAVGDGGDEDGPYVGAVAIGGVVSHDEEFCCAVSGPDFDRDGFGKDRPDAKGTSLVVEDVAHLVFEGTGCSEREAHAGSLV